MYFLSVKVEIVKQSYVYHFKLIIDGTELLKYGEEMGDLERGSGAILRIQNYYFVGR